jgi:hypothetical protein
MNVLYIWLFVTYGCHFQVWQNHINCLLEELGTQLFPVLISPSAEKSNFILKLLQNYTRVSMSFWLYYFRENVA